MRQAEIIGGSELSGFMVCVNVSQPPTSLTSVSATGWAFVCRYNSITMATVGVYEIANVNKYIVLILKYFTSLYYSSHLLIYVSRNGSIFHNASSNFHFVSLPSFHTAPFSPPFPK